MAGLIGPGTLFGLKIDPLRMKCIANLTQGHQGVRDDTEREKFAK